MDIADNDSSEERASCVFVVVVALSAYLFLTSLRVSLVGGTKALGKDANEGNVDAIRGTTHRTLHMAKIMIQTMTVTVFKSLPFTVVHYRGCSPFCSGVRMFW